MGLLYLYEKVERNTTNLRLDIMTAKTYVRVKDYLSEQAIKIKLTL
jgi:hypothetical protein